jgi:hypothetical protein
LEPTQWWRWCWLKRFERVAEQGLWGHGVGFWAFWLNEMNIYTKRSHVLADFKSYVQNNAVSVTSFFSFSFFFFFFLFIIYYYFLKIRFNNQVGINWNFFTYSQLPI